MTKAGVSNTPCGPPRLPVLTVKTVHVADFLADLVGILTDFGIDKLGINLRGKDVLMPQHPLQGLQRHTLGKGQGGIGVAADMRAEPDAAARLQVMQLSQYNASGISDDPCEKVLDKLLVSLCGLYDYIIIDCGLKHELLTVNALAAADYCIIPVQARFLASEGIPDVLEMVRNVQNRFNPDLKIAGILLTMYQSRPQLCQSVRSSVGEIYGDSIHVFDRPIEQTIKVAECPAAGMSILDYAPKNPAADSYRSLAQEVLRLG